MVDTFVCVPRDLLENVAILKKDHASQMALPVKMEEPVSMPTVLLPKLHVNVFQDLLAIFVKSTQTIVNPTLVGMGGFVLTLDLAFGAIALHISPVNPVKAQYYSVAAALAKMRGLATSTQ